MSHYLFSYDEIYNLICTLYDRNFDFQIHHNDSYLGFCAIIIKKYKRSLGGMYYFRKDKDDKSHLCVFDEESELEEIVSNFKMPNPPYPPGYAKALITKTFIF